METRAALAKSFQKGLSAKPQMSQPVTTQPVVTAPGAPVATSQGFKTTIDPKTGQIKSPDQLIGSAVNYANQDYTGAKDEAYNYITKDYGSQKALKMEAVKHKQETRLSECRTQTLHHLMRC
jgi:molybdopterin biosynthesis enzyme